MKTRLFARVVAIFLLTGSVITLFTKFPQAASVAPWFPSLLVGSTAVTLVCAAGAWMLQRWSAWTYATLAVSFTILGVDAFGHFSRVGCAYARCCFLVFVTREPVHRA
jgi:hypothetical protein